VQLCVLDLSIAGPVVGTLAFLDVVLHVVLDLKKIRSRQVSEIQEPDTSVSTAAMAAIGVSTLLSFLVVFSISLAWLLSSEQVLFLWVIPVIDVPCPLWIAGLTILSVGILLHGWSRLARRNMASSWAMAPGHRLVQTGPYSRIRHPSYAAYMLSFLGLLLMVPSVVTLVILVGIPGYYYVTVPEEDLLVSRFGDEYREYAARTGKFLPRTRKRQAIRPKP
jgi:protein-S-isoprenylcysteine O-methyltransferase Ste14